MFRRFLRWLRRGRRSLGLSDDATQLERDLTGQVNELTDEVEKLEREIELRDHTIQVAATENRLLAAVNERNIVRVEAETLKADLGAFKISDRNRIAYRDRSSTDEWRYRNRIKLAYPIPVKKITLVPFVSEEIFFPSLK